MHRGDVFARSEGGINTFGLTFAKQPDAIRTERLISETTSGRPHAKPSDEIVRGPSV
jgi:two-component system heavy metal sensor histidine kinase CusS